MSQHKPLPALPSSSALSTLSVESRNHRARLIRHFLVDIQEPGIEARRDGWACVLEEALDEMSEEMGRGDWLAAVKRGKQLKKDLGKSSSTKMSSETKPTKHIEASTKVTQDGSKHENAVDSQQNKGSGDIPTTLDEHTSPFHQLLGLNARPPLPPGEQRPGHLLLCLAPHGNRLPLPTEDRGFDIIPANIGCAFTPATFAVKKNEGEMDGTVLYGLGGLESESFICLRSLF